MKFFLRLSYLYKNHRIVFGFGVTAVQYIYLVLHPLDMACHGNVIKCNAFVSYNNCNVYQGKVNTYIISPFTNES